MEKARQVGVGDVVSGLEPNEQCVRGFHDRMVSGQTPTRTRDLLLPKLISDEVAVGDIDIRTEE